MRIVLGVGGGIAAYKAADLVRTLKSRGHDIQVVMTRAACRFVQPLTFAALSGHPVISRLFTPSHAPAGDSDRSAVDHIEVAKEHDLLLVAPATADLLARFAHGFADDFLTTTFLAFTGTVVLAPAMNTRMWEHAATQANLRLLESRGCHVLDPDSGVLACGTEGVGRLPDAGPIADFVEGLMLETERRRDLEGDTILVTAGPTIEPIDPVRFLSNRSSGKMGYAIAAAAVARGARVILISGPVQIQPPAGIQLISVETAEQMRQAVLANVTDASVVIKAAAVADYYVAEPPLQKLKKTATRLSLALDPTPDILAELGGSRRDYLLVGFAAETQNVLEEARRKLLAKNCDMVVGNQVGREGLGFESEQNEVDIVLRTGEVVHAGPAPKRKIADVLLGQVARLRLSLHALKSAVG